MADGTQIGEEIARNLVRDPQLTQPMPGGVNVKQVVLSGGMGVTLGKGADDGPAYAAPWSDIRDVAGDKIGVLIVSTNTLTPPDGGVSMDTGGNGEPVWLRGNSSSYMEVMAVRVTDPTQCRLYAPADGVLTVVKSGVFTIDSWEQMQERGIIYFDPGSMVYATESGYTLPPATTTTRGGITVGDGLTVTPDGRLSVIPQDVPVATQDTAGVVKIGRGLRTTADGTLEPRLGANLQFDSTGNIESTAETGMPDMSDYFTKSESDARYPTKEYVDDVYAKKTDIPSGDGDKVYATEDWVESNFVSQSDFTKYRIVKGNISLTVGPDSQFRSQELFFNAGFTSTPVVMVECSNTQVNCCIQGTSSTKFTIACYAINGGTQNVTGSWIAIGPVD